MEGHSIKGDVHIHITMPNVKLADHINSKAYLKKD